MKSLNNILYVYRQHVFICIYYYICVSTLHVASCMGHSSSLLRTSSSAHRDKCLAGWALPCSQWTGWVGWVCGMFVSFGNGSMIKAWCKSGFLCMEKSLAFQWQGPIGSALEAVFAGAAFVLFLRVGDGGSVLMDLL